MPSAPRVYNPFTLTNGIHRVLAEPDRRRAAEGAWPSAWSESGHPGLAARLAADTRQPLPTDAAKGGLPPLPTPGTGDLARLMLDTGYYTWHGGRGDTPAYLNFPNREVAESWTYDILGLWEHAPERDGRLIADLKACLVADDLTAFGQRLEDFTFGLAHQNLQSEAACRTLLQALFVQMEFPAQSEKSNWGGRSDHEVHVGDRGYVFEVKYNQSADAALRQIRDRGYGREHLHADRPVTAVGLAFRRDLKTGPCLQVAQADLDKVP